MIRWAALLLLAAGPAWADARLDLSAAQPLSPLAELVITGENKDDGPRSVTIRVDDQPGADYTGRVNEERIMPPGPFTLRLRLALLRTPRHRPLNVAAAFRAIAFADGRVTFGPLRLDAPPSLPPGVLGWSFGPAAAMPMLGFDAVQPDDPRISGPHIEQLSRPGGDPVLASGTRLTSFTPTLPPGRWRLTLWTEDPGEWETLPPVLQQRIRVNGTDLLYVSRDYAGWIAQRYLAGRAVEADPAQPPFATTGALRGGRVTGIVTVPADGVLRVELAGFPQPATHLSAMVAEPADAPPAAGDAVEALRAARFAENWPVLAKPQPAAPVDVLTAAPMAQGVTAAGGVAILRTDIRVPAPVTATTSIAWDGAPLPSHLLWGQWRWRRPGANSAGLLLSAASLRGDSGTIPLRPDLPRPLVLVVQVPPGTQPGLHQGAVRLHTPSGDTSVAFAVDVLAADRPDPAARPGVFLGFAPHLLGTPEWSKDAARRDARAQAGCDMDTLAGLGLTAITAPMGNPQDEPEAFVADIRAVLKRFPAPVIAYEPLRALAARLPAADAAAALARADAAVRAAGLPPVIWSIADEPAYAGITAQVHALAAEIHRIDPDALLAGHLNDQRDAALLPDLAMVTVNQAYGADAADIASLRAAHLRPWLYNMPLPRLSAGAYLWRSGADGLLQWHARMPTADPFDPTDGREGDVQFLWPAPGVCAAPDLDADLLQLAEGAEDLRWLAWLEQAAPRDATAASLLGRLRADIPAHWAQAAALPADQPARWRAQIVAVARKIGPVD